MSVRFWRRIRLFPGVTLNVSKTGVSITIGVRGARWTIGRTGHTASVGLPGTGLSYRKQISHEDVIDETRELVDDETKDRRQERDERSVWSDYR